MKTSGQEIKVYEDVLVLPRNPENLNFLGRAITDFGPFNALCPAPEPPVLNTPEGKKAMVTDVGYQQQLTNYSIKKLAWVLMATLYEVEWDTVDMDDPNTWNNWTTECAESGMSELEQQHLVQFVLQMNAMSEKAMDAARSDFMAHQASQLELPGSPTNVPVTS